jgi:UDP-2,3-diacylglucosamine hydrolase
VDAAAARVWLSAAGAATLIHGHTHKPGEYGLGVSSSPGDERPGAGAPTLRRVVLSDWDATALPPRVQVLRLSADGLQRIAIA